MNELKRMYSRKMFIIALLVFLNTGIFLITAGGDSVRNITLTGEELSAYIASYPDFIERTQKSAETLLALPMYKNDRFAAESIAKTAADYRRLSGTVLTAGDNRGIVFLLGYHLTDLIIAAFLTAAAIGFHAERRKGLVSMVRSTPLGRGRLCLLRIGLLTLSAGAAGLLLYGSDLIAAYAHFSSQGLSRALQSLPEFMECPYNVTIGEFLAVCALVKTAAALAAALLIYLLTSLFSTASAYAIAGAAGAAELLLYTLLPAVSGLRGLKYVNIFAAFDIQEIFRVSRYINIAGNAVPAARCLVWVLIMTLFLLSAALLLIQSRAYPVNKSFPGNMGEIIGKIRDIFPSHRTIAGWEARKLLINCRGIILITAAFLLTLSAANKYGYSYPIDTYEAEWYEKFHGTVTEETVNEIAKNHERLEWNIERTKKQIASCMESENPNYELLGRLQMQLEEYEHRLTALIPVEENANGCLEYTLSTGRELMLIKPYSYDLLLKKDMGTVRRASLYALIGIIAAVSGVYAYDRQNGMSHIITAAYRGRAATHAGKLLSLCGICLITSAALHLIQLYQIHILLEYNDLAAPIQSLEFMRDFPVYMTVSEYLLLLFAVRGAAGCIAGLICAAVSRVSLDTGTAMGISAFLLAVPSLISQVMGSGFPDMVSLMGGEFFM